MTADEVKDALRRRHPATQSMGVRTVPGAWTCVEELLGCDLLAIAAHKRPVNGPAGAKYPRVGYEVKVSRSDYRAELRSPAKRRKAVEFVHAFYLAVPAGLLKPTELILRGPSGDGQRTLWIPDDVGLVVVTARGCSVVHEAPVRTPARIDRDGLLGAAARFISSHPDPRHAGVVEADRALCQQLRDDERRRKAESAARWRAYLAEHGID